MILTNEERDKFAAYLEQSARDNDTAAVECRKIGADGMAKVLELDAKCYKHVAGRLRLTQSQEISTREG